MQINMVSEMVQLHNFHIHSNLMISLRVHEYTHSHSTTTLSFNMCMICTNSITFSDIFLSYEYSFTFKVIISIQHRCYILYASLFTHQDTSILNNVFLVSMDVTSLYTPGGYSKTFFSWEAAPRGPTPHPYIPFWTEKVCFSNTFY